MTAIVYMARNLINGKRYIGITAHHLRVRVLQHYSAGKRLANKMPITRAIHKYGRDMLRFSVLMECATYEDAKLQEIRLISLLRPEYNISGGGEGFLGYKPTDEVRKRLSERAKGRIGHWAGKKLPRHIGDATRARNLTKERVAEWGLNRQRGPRAPRYYIMCAQDGKVYNGLSAAAKAYGLTRTSVKQVCDNKKSQTGGYVFTYAGRIPLKVAKERLRDWKKPVVCLDDGKIYDSCEEAARAYKLSSSGIHLVCAKKPSRKTAGGLVFRFVGESHGGKLEAEQVRASVLKSRQRTAVLAREALRA